MYIELRPHAPVGPPQITTVGDALQIDISGSQPSGEPPNYTNASVQGYLNGFLIRVEAEDSGYIYHFMVGFCHLSLCIISLIFDSLFQYSADPFNNLNQMPLYSNLSCKVLNVSFAVVNRYGRSGWSPTTLVCGGGTLPVYYS